MKQRPAISLVLPLGVAAGLLVTSLVSPTAATAGEAKPPTREIYVPFKDLEVLLQSQPRRVLLSRQEYEALLAKAVRSPETPAPCAAVLMSADYEATVEDERVRIAGRLSIDVLEEGLHAVPLDADGITLVRAALDGRGAPIGREGRRLVLFVEGKGQHTLVLEVVAPLTTAAARQECRFCLPRPAADKLHLVAPGDVELQGGADVINRQVDAAAGVTRFDLARREAATTLVMTLNSHLARRERAVSARSVMVDEVTEAYERLHAAISWAVLRRAADEFRVALPAGFEATEVTTPLLSRWSIQSEGGKRVLAIRLREPATDTVVVNLSAVRVPPPLDAWSMPRLEPLDVVGQAAVVGLLVDERLKAESIAAESLIPIDTSVLRQAIPASAFRAEPGAPAIRPVAAWYAPQADFGISARFVRPPAELTVTTNALLVLEDKGQQVKGGFLFAPAVERLFGFDFSVPAGWDVRSVTGEDGKPLAIERYASPQGPGRVHVRLARAVAPGQDARVYFEAARTPEGWLGEWKSTRVEFPVFAATGATRDVGAIAVLARDDLAARPDTLDRLTPLDETEKARYLAGVATNLAYRYEGQPYRATFSLERTQPRQTAATYSFLQIRPGLLSAHYELVYQVEEARASQLAFLLPESTPGDLAVRALDGVKVKEFLSEPAGEGRRRWKVLLAEPLRGRIRLAADFETPLKTETDKSIALPLVRADGVAWQSGWTSVEGDAELSVEVQADPRARRVDVGELTDAEYQPGRRLLGVYGFVGTPPAMTANVAVHPGYGLYPAIVQSAAFTTRLSADGKSETKAEFQLRSKAACLEVQLTEGAKLWSAEWDGRPLSPQREGKSLLVAIPPAPQKPATLRIVYQMAARRVGLLGHAAVPSPRLFVHGVSGETMAEVPIADLTWTFHAPPGYEVVRSTGTVAPELAPRSPAVLGIARAAVGLVFFVPAHLATRESARPAASPYYQRDDAQYHPAPAAAPPAASPPTTPAPALMPRKRKMAEDENKPMSGESARESGSEAAVPEQQMQVDRLKSVEGAAGQEAAASYGKASFGMLEGFRSLAINLEPSPGDAKAVTFKSLGGDPLLAVTLADRQRLGWIGWSIALAVVLGGLALTRAKTRAKVRYLAAVILAGTILPMIPGLEFTAGPADMAVYAGALLIPYYLAAGLVRMVARRLRQVDAIPATTATVAFLAVAGMASMAAADEPKAASGPYVIQVVEPAEPVKVPEDAVILPFDPDSQAGVQGADRVMVPYDRYVELWNLAHPDKKLESRQLPARYALAGAAYRTRLDGEQYLEITGRLEIDVYSEAAVEVPFSLAGAVLTRAELDDKPARLRVIQPIMEEGQPVSHASGPITNRTYGVSTAQPPVAQVPSQDASFLTSNQPPATSNYLLHLAAKGRHTLDLAARVRLARRGGWHVAAATLPSAPASSFAITVPKPGTEVRLAGITDRTAYETEHADQVIETGLGSGGTLHVEWRPKVAEAQVDRSLTARSTAVFDVQEDGLRMAWALNLAFPRAQYDTFRLRVPGDYLVEKVSGANVRGWQIEKGDRDQAVSIDLLKTARDSEQFAIQLGRAGAVGSDALDRFDVPAVRVEGASLEAGDVAIRRSPLLELRTEEVAGASRTDLPADAAKAAGSSEDSPLGIRPYEAYRFAGTSYAIRLAAQPVAARVTARVQSVLKIAAFERTLESRVLLHVSGRPVFRIEVLLPDGLELDEVSAPAPFQWAVTRQNGQRRLTAYLAAGQQGEVPLVVRGRLGKDFSGNDFPLPRLEVLGLGGEAEGLDGAIAVQTDPAFDVDATNLENCQSGLVRQVLAWLKPEQAQATRLAITYRRPDFGGRLRLRPRQADVRCLSTSNVRVTERALEETILLDYTIEKAGIRQVEFTLPEWMKDARIQAPMLREKTIQPQGDKDRSVLVRLELQDDVMGQLRILVENDRLLEPERDYAASVPAVHTGQVDRQFVALESAGRDEVIVDQDRLRGLEPVVRQQRDWERLQALLGEGVTQAYVASGSGPQPQLVFRTRRRTALETSGARIGLAETRLAVDPSGAYRGEQVYWIDNRTEPYLEVELPAGARLWTAQLWTAQAWADRVQGRAATGEPVKPTRPPGSKDPRVVRVPLVKTALGDLDYVVRLLYGGVMPGLDGIGRADFPLVHTAKIRVELSQVRLYLPEPYRFRFDGTMRHATGEEELLAGWRQYQTKKAEDLRQTLRQDDPFAQVRAANSLRNLEGQAAQIEAGKYRGRSGRDLEGIFQQAERDIAHVQQSLQAGVEADNRARLGERFQEQKTARARNTLQDLGANFEGPPQAATPASVPEEASFNPKWLDKGQLSNAPPGEKPAVGQEQESLGRLQAFGRQEAAATKQSADKDLALRGPGISQGGQPAPPASVPIGAGGFRGGVAQAPSQPSPTQARDLVNRYQEKLEDQQAQVNAPADAEIRRHAAAGRRADELSTARLKPSSSMAAAATPTTPAPSATGLASLDVEFPARGAVYLFTTPQGDTRITAWAVSTRLIGRVAWIVGSLAAAAVVLFIFPGRCSKVAACGRE